MQAYLVWARMGALGGQGEFFVLNGCPVSLGPRVVIALKEMA